MPLQKSFHSWVCHYQKKLYQKNITKIGYLILVLNTDGSSITHGMSTVKELSGGLCKTCVLFEKSTKYLGVFVKNVFQDVSKTEKITDYAGLHHHLAVIMEAERFVKDCKDPTNNVGFHKDKEVGY